MRVGGLCRGLVARLRGEGQIAEAPPDPGLLWQASLAPDGLKQGRTWLVLNTARLSFKGICIDHGCSEVADSGLGVVKVKDLCSAQYSLSLTVQKEEPGKGARVEYTWVAGLGK